MGLLLYWQDLRVHHGVCECELVLIRGNFHELMCMSFKCVSLFDWMRIPTVRCIPLAPVRSVPATAFQALNGLRPDRVACPAERRSSLCAMPLQCELKEDGDASTIFTLMITDVCAWADTNQSTQVRWSPFGPCQTMSCIFSCLHKANLMQHSHPRKPKRGKPSNKGV